jgi:hypothetical protein
VEIVRLAHERLNEGDINRLIAVCDGDFELDMSARVMNPETYRGHEGIRRFYREVSEVWEEFRWEPLRFFEAGCRPCALPWPGQGKRVGDGSRSRDGLDGARTPCDVGPLLHRSRRSPRSRRAAGVAALDEKRRSGPGVSPTNCDERLMGG